MELPVELYGMAYALQAIFLEAPSQYHMDAAMSSYTCHQFWQLLAVKLLILLQAHR